MHRNSAAAIEEFKSAAPESPISSGSLTKYMELQKFVQSVASLCGENDTSSEGSIGLLPFLESVRERTWTDIKSILLECVRALRISLVLTLFQKTGRCG